ncbi:MAG TPA: hypothetical protein VIU46_08405 [Gallionellaceae bacterium]
MKYISSSSTASPSLLHKTGALIVAVAAFGLMLMFSAVLLAVLLVLIVAGGAYLWWKTRKVRRMMREMRAAANDAQANRDDVFRGEAFREESKGVVIEGEAVRVHVPQDGSQR